MMISLVTIGKRKPDDTPLRQTVRSYIERACRYTPVEERALRDEEGLFFWRSRQTHHAASWLVLLDSRGKPLTSDQLASELGRWRDAGKRQMILAVGPSDGWSAESRARADFLLSFGPITLPHELAAVVAAEQVYRALTILAGHPYHCDH